VSKWIQLIQPWRFPEKGFGNRGKLFSPGHVRQLPDDEADTLCLTLCLGRPVARSLEFTRGAEGERIAGARLNGPKVATPWALDLDVNVEYGPPVMMWDDNLIWDTTAALRMEMIPIGYNLLEKWDIAVPLMPESVLAVDLGTLEERQLTEEVIHDLRVPVYDTRVMFVNRNRTTERLMGIWHEEQDNGTALAFMRALGKVQPKPLICALPASWIETDE